MHSQKTTILTLNFCDIFRKGLKPKGLVTNAKKPLNLKNPIRLDPTKTGAIRRAFMADVRKRFAKLRSDVFNFVATQDALGLKDRANPVLNATAQPRQYEFLNSPQKVAAFRTWLTKQVDAGVLSVEPGTDPDKPWTSKYVTSAYKKGLGSSYSNTPQGKRAAVLGGTTQEEFMATAFASPETTKKIELLATRAFENMRGITTTMGAKLNSILASGMADGTGPLQIARDMVAQIDISQSRALTIARTETIYAHAEGQIDGYEDLGVAKLGVQMEFSTAGDEYVCPICESMEGKQYSIEEARGIIPVHPNCVLGDSIVEADDILALTRVKYFGKIFKFTTKAGHNFSVTEHHTLLTAQGWRFAKQLKPGAELIDAASCDAAFVNQNQNDSKLTIAQIFQTLSETTPESCVAITRSSTEDFHGDGASLDQEVHVVLSNRCLRHQINPSFLAQVEKLSFMDGSIAKSSPGHGMSMLHKALVAAAAASDGFVSPGSIAAIIGRRSTRHHQTVGFSIGTDFNADMLQPVLDTAARASEFFAKLIQAFAQPVLFDEIVNVEVMEAGSGGVFVFDVSTHASMYVLNGILSSNCRCSWLPAFNADDDQ